MAVYFFWPEMVKLVWRSLRVELQGWLEPHDPSHTAPTT